MGRGPRRELMHLLIMTAKFQPPPREPDLETEVTWLAGRTRPALSGILPIHDFYGTGEIYGSTRAREMSLPHPLSSADSPASIPPAGSSHWTQRSRLCARSTMSVASIAALPGSFHSRERTNTRFASRRFCYRRLCPLTTLRR
jgi:hypothetical protein